MCAALPSDPATRSRGVTDVPDPFTGDLDGSSILVDYDLDAEEALFILVHLFGHTVQWNVSPNDRALGLLEVRNPSAELLASLARYEVDAARYSLQLFHEAGVRDLDQWLADFAAPVVPADEVGDAKRDGHLMGRSSPAAFGLRSE